jgi:hypothetical protein
MASDAELTAQGQRENHEDRLDEQPSRRWWALAVIAIAQLMVVLDGTVVTIALPSAQPPGYLTLSAVTSRLPPTGGLLQLKYGSPIIRVVSGASWLG